MISATSIPITSTSFHFISQLNHKRGRPPSKPWKLTLGFCIFFIITSFIGYTGHAQSSQCGTVEVLTNLPTPDCTLGSYDQLCIRTKMHFLNNTNGEMDSPEDKYFLNLLSQINEVFLGYKIHLTFDYNCINRSDIGPISSASEISYLISQNDPDVEYDSNSINLYFLQDGASISIGSYANKHLVSKLDDFGLIIHELGHVLGLRHTFPGTGNIVAIDLYCKNPLATYDPPIDHLIRCEHLDDRICDTGLDPFNFDLDGDTIRDGFKWIDINTCEQKPELTPSFADGCGDDTTSWDIPVRNFMSYYTACRSEFTPCQYGTIHEQMLLKPEVIMDCEEDPYDPALSVCSDPDITISTITTWTNELIELCPGQKIIITPCGHLTLDNTTITRKETSIVNELCPNLNYEQLWDGIYLEGEGDYIIIEGALLSKGGLTVKNGSLVEYSKKGIQGLQGFGRVIIKDSEFRHNHSILSLRDPWPFSYGFGHPCSQEGTGAVFGSYINGSCDNWINDPYPSVRIEDCTLDIGSNELALELPSKTQILVDGGTLAVINSNISNPNTLGDTSDLTAIKSGRGRLSFLNGSKVENFTVGIFKAADIYNNCAERGLYIDNSSIHGCKLAIHNTSQFVNVNYGYLEGNIISEGLTYAAWNITTFKRGILNDSNDSGNFASHAAEESVNLTENLFEDYTLEFYQNNSKSNSVCNTWRGMNNGFAVFGDVGAQLPSIWSGLEGESAGNIHLDGNVLPIMLAEVEVLNYFNPQNTAENFQYINSMQGIESPPSNCDHGQYPEGFAEHDTSFTEIAYSVINEENNFNYLDSTKVVRLNEYVRASDLEKPAIQVQIDRLEMEISDVVRKVLFSIGSGDENIEASWISRANPAIFELSELIAYFYKRDFTGIDSMLDSPPSDDAVFFLKAIEYLSGLQSRNISIDSLSTLEVDTLSDMSMESFGNYTNIIRNFLNLSYDRYFLWPVDSNRIEARSGKVDKKDEISFSKPVFTIYPNPVERCFTIHAENFKEHLLDIILFDLNGRIVYMDESKVGTQVCLNTLPAGIFILQLRDTGGSIHEFHKLVIK